MRYRPRRPFPQAYAPRPWRLVPLVKMDRETRAWLRHLELCVDRAMPSLPQAMIDLAVYGQSPPDRAQ